MDKNITQRKGIDELEKLKVKCICGHSIIMPVYRNTTICSYCGRLVRNTTKLYFEYQLRKQINKIKGDNNG